MKRIVGSTLLTLALGFACRTTLTGNEGNLAFSYISDDRITDFNKPLAIGARLDIQVQEAGNRRSVTLDAAQFEAQGGLKVVGFNGDTVTVEATEEDNGLLQVSASTSGGEELADSVNLTARKSEKLELNHSCVTERDGRYLINNRILIPFELERDNGQPTIGYGYYPVTFDGSASLELDRSIKAQQYLHIDTGAESGTIEIKSDIDDTTLSVALVSPDDINGVDLVLGSGQETDVGETDLYYVLPTIDGERVCQANTQKSVSSLTPDVCEVEDRDDPALENNEAAVEFGWFSVKGVAAGTCKVEVTYTRSGASGSVDIKIAP